MGAGANSSGRKLNVEHIEEATFGFSSGLWIDRGGSLLFSATWDHKTDRRLAIDVFPGVISIARNGSPNAPGSWRTSARASSGTCRT